MGTWTEGVCACGWKAPRNMRVNLTTRDPASTATITLTCPECGNIGDKTKIKDRPVSDSPAGRPAMTDAHILAVALGNAIATADEAMDDDEDIETWLYCKRVLAAWQAGDMGPIREEIRAEEERANEAAEIGARPSGGD